MEHVDFHTRTLLVTRSKSGEGRRVPMNCVVVETLQALRKARKVFRGVVFTSPRGECLHNFGRAWAETVKNAKITDIRFHDLRHTAASRMVMSGVDLYTVKEILGHKTLVMTQRYAHLSPALSGTQSSDLHVGAEGAGKQLTPLLPEQRRGDEWGRCNYRKKWWTGGELNSRHRDFQSPPGAETIGRHRSGCVGYPGISLRHPGPDPPSRSGPIPTTRSVQVPPKSRRRTRGKESRAHSNPAKSQAGNPDLGATWARPPGARVRRRASKGTTVGAAGRPGSWSAASFVAPSRSMRSSAIAYRR